MREILFRGKRIDNGEWIEGYYVKAVHHWHKHGIHEDWLITGAAANGGWFAIHNRHAVDPATVGQYTGLTDKNGKKIFEGDIVRYEIQAGACVVFRSDLMHVEWSEQTAQFIVTGDCSYIMDSANKYEIIGNIHDNPEL